VESHLHLVHDLQRAQQGAEGRQAEVALFQRKLSRHVYLAGVRLISHGYRNGALVTAYGHLHVGEPLRP
jgi:hypothetical protein